MGLNDDREMLEACKADAAQLERDLALAHTSIDLERHHRLRAERALADVRRLAEDRDHDEIEADPIWPHEILAIVGATSDAEHDPGTLPHDQHA